MQNLVHDIFLEYEYRLLSEVDGSEMRYGLVDQNKADYYICCFCDDNTNLRDYSNQVELSFSDENYYSKNKSDPARKKNTSIIFFVETTDVLEFEKQNQKLIYDIEESTYYLKKYVLVYSQYHVYLLNKHVGQNEEKTSLKKKMEVIISDVGEYRKSAKSNKSDSLYSFVLKLYAKIPFTSYNVRPEPRIGESLEKIEKEINDQKDDTVKSVFSTYIDQKWTKEDLEQVAKGIEITDEEIENYITQKITVSEGD
ncbi:ABC-three component system middle component 1 [Enterococcus thailandicus]|uniref:ABC-three component system middle component 1 n=1 Tax=Enterococcus thailandicus TaxID=417368 RepID=UPI0035D5D4ED